MFQRDHVVFRRLRRREPVHLLAPWQLSFSYARALQDPVLKAWKGEQANWDAAQKALAHRAKLNSAAREGSYSTDMEEG